jgi:protein-S-isoprenylcysteine O-methyltransferase Ste14
MPNAVVSRIHALFNSPSLRRILVKGRGLLTLIIGALVIVNAKAELFWWAFGVSAFGELGQLWCFASLKKQKILATRGPYVLMRNPMYVARYFLILGCLIFLGSPVNPWLAAAYTVLYYFYMANRVRREERKLAPIFGEDYERYCRETNRFLPTLRNRKWGDVWFFKWELLVGNHGVVNAVGLLAFYAAAYLYLFLYVR